MPTNTYTNVKDHGALGTAGDDTAALQAAVAACPLGGTLFFPAGDYRTTQALNLPISVSVLGEGYRHDKGSIIRRIGTPGTLFDWSDWASGEIANCTLLSTGHCIDVTATQNCSIRNVRANAGAGCWVVYSAGNLFSLRIDNVQITGTPNCTANGIMASSHSLMTNLDINGCDEGVRVCGVCNRIIGGRIEVCNLAVNVGRDHVNSYVGASLTGIEGVTFESNKMALKVRGNYGSYRDLWIHAFHNASPGGTDQDGGMWLEWSSGCTYQNIICTVHAPGKPAVLLEAVDNTRFDHVSALNSGYLGTAISGPGMLNGKGNIFER